MTISKDGFNLTEFEEQWTDLGKNICQAIYVHPDVQKLKNSLVKNGFLTLEEKSKFIDICDKTKYDIIYDKYGGAESDGYKSFSEQWRMWFQAKGVESQKNRSQRSSVDHILFGSTPDPVEFLLHFEHEMLGSMKPKQS